MPRDLTPPPDAPPVGRVLALPQEQEPAPDSSIPGALLRHFEHGATAGFSDEIVGAGDALGGGRTFGNTSARPGTFADLYRQSRDARRAQLKADKEQHPIASTLADIAGGLATMRSLGGGNSLKAALKMGAIQGGLRGAGESEAQTGTPEELANTAIGAGLGAVGGGFGYGAGRLVAPAGRWLGEKLRGKFIDQGRKVLGGGTTPLTVAKKPVSEGVIEAAGDAGAFRPGGTTQGAADRIADKLDETDSVRRAIVDALESRGVQGPEAEVLGQKLAAEGSAVAQGTFNPTVPKVYTDVADQLTGPAARFRGRLGFKQAEELKRGLQEDASGAYSSLFPKAVGRARRSAASMMRQSIEDEAMQQAQASGDPALQLVASQFAPYKQATGKLIEASRAAEEGAARAARRSGPSLTDTMVAAPMMAAHGLPAGFLAKHLSSIARTRGPSTLAWAARAGSKAAGKAGPLQLAPAGVALGDEETSALIDLLRGRKQLPPVGLPGNEE